MLGTDCELKRVRLMVWLRADWELIYFLVIWWYYRGRSTRWGRGHESQILGMKSAVKYLDTSNFRTGIWSHVIRCGSTREHHFLKSARFAWLYLAQTSLHGDRANREGHGWATITISIFWGWQKMNVFAIAKCINVVLWGCGETLIDLGETRKKRILMHSWSLQIVCHRYELPTIRCYASY